MQTIHQDEDEGSDSEETNLVGPLICIGEISRYMEREYIGGFVRRTIGI